MLIGDFNGRVGLSQNHYAPGYHSYILESYRKSKDQTCDIKGTKILELADEYDMRLLNGCCKGDKEGELTFIRGTSCSVIDFCFAAGQWYHILDSFQVGCEIFSDHMPLEVALRFDINRNHNDPKPLNLLPKIVWNNKFLKNYQQNMNVNLRNLPEELIPDIEVLTEVIKKSIPEPENLNFLKTYKKKWFDAECLRARDRSFKCLKLLRSNNSNVFKSLYQNANRDYKRICHSKKISFEQQNIAIIKSSKSTAQFWKAVKYLNGSKSKIAPALKAPQLKTHFDQLLNTPQATPHIQ